MRDRREWKRRSLFSPRYVGNERRKSHHWALILFGSVLLTAFTQQYVISAGIVVDKSMYPTLKDGEYYLINKYIYRLARPHRGDIVILLPWKYATEEYVKRVIGLEGETFSIKNGEVYINGQAVSEPYAIGKTGPDMDPFEIPKGKYFVMGDNRANSMDSRAFGAVEIGNIEGKIKPGEIFPLR